MSEEQEQDRRNPDNLQIDEDMIEVPENYGFKANLRQKFLDIVRRNEWLEKINIPYAITIKGLIILMLTLGTVILSVSIPIINDFTRAKYIAPGLIGLGASVFMLVLLTCLLMPSYGSLFKSGYSFIRQFFKRSLILLGLKKPERKTKIHKVRNDGVILYTNGDFGKLYRVDGRTSATAYPSEILEQQEITRKYHKGRTPLTPEFHITSSQRQNTDKQLSNLETLANSTSDRAKYDLINLEYTYLSTSVNGVKQVFENHIILRAKTDQKLRELMQRFEGFGENQGMYYAIEPYDKSQTKDFLSDFFELR